MTGSFKRNCGGVRDTFTIANARNDFFLAARVSNVVGSTKNIPPRIFTAEVFPSLLSTSFQSLVAGFYLIFK
jgi:hypothetical protein